MLPGKKYKPIDLLLILRRRFWLLLVPFAVVSAGTAVYARWLPDMYRSDTLILVVPQRIPESYVRSTVTARIEDRLNSISQQILSRTRLERIIQDFNLYAEERRVGIMEDIVERMRRDINITVVKGDAFRVGYSGDNPRTVMKVTDRLASLFIEESVRDREVFAEGTNQFLEAQLEDARRRLVEHETKRANYRKQFAGQLPDQLEGNLQAASNTQLQIRAVVEAINRNRERRLILERQIADLEGSGDGNPAVVPANLQTTDGTLVGGNAAQQLEAARAQLAAMQLRLKDDHPDVARARRAINELQAKAQAEAAAAANGGDVVRLSPAEAARQRRLRDLRGEIQQLDSQIGKDDAEEKRLRAIAGRYQASIEATPTRETEMTELNRDYSMIQGLYNSLLSKKEESQLSANLERRQIGEQFKLLDPARLPERPFSPDRQQINMMGLFGGLVIGVGLIALLELKDTTYKTDEDVMDVLNLPVLAVVPLMQSGEERKRAFRLRIAMHATLGFTVAACLGVVAYTFIR